MIPEINMLGLKFNRNKLKEMNIQNWGFHDKENQKLQIKN